MRSGLNLDWEEEEEENEKFIQRVLILQSTGFGLTLT
jgi:hypothetical protein